MKNARPQPFAPRLTPLAASLALLLAAAHSHDASALSDRYALRLQQRHAVATGQALPAAAPRAKPSRPAGVLPVTSCADDADPGTLRNVLAGAVEGDTVDLSQLACSTITLTQGALDTSVLGEHPLYDLTLQGPGRGALTITAATQSQVLVVGGFSSDKGTFTINDLTIADGTYTGGLAGCVHATGGTVALNRVTVTNCYARGTVPIVFGGALDASTVLLTDSSITDSVSEGTGPSSTAIGGGFYASDTAVLINSTVSGNRVTSHLASDDGYATLGGGIYARGNLTLINSTISDNSVEATDEGQDAPGGGIYVHGVATITGSTIENNRADGDGGGIFKAVFSPYGDPPPPQDTKLTITNSTIAGNSAAHGGGIATSRPLYLSNSTVAFNNAGAGGGGLMFRLDGIYDSSGILDIQSSIVSNNAAGDGATLAADIDADGAVAITGANNLAQAVGSTLAMPTDTLNADPQLLPMAANGGPTPTLALGLNSPAIDAGNNVAKLAVDQRGEGFVRVSGAAADIGAFEVQQPDDVIFKDGFDGVPAKSDGWMVLR